MVWHFRAWTFDPAAFHRWLDPQLFIDGDYSYLLLRDVAMDAASHVNATTVEYLECFGLAHNDPEAWELRFGTLEPELHPPWYVYSMAGHLTSCPGFTEPTFWTLQRTLPGNRASPWDVARVAQLLHGFPLQWLLEDFGDERLHRVFGAELREARSSAGGGWLSRGVVRQLRRELDRPAPPWLSPHDRDTLADALAEITVMLDTAIQRGAALRLAQAY